MSEEAEKLLQRTGYAPDKPCFILKSEIEKLAEHLLAVASTAREKDGTAVWEILGEPINMICYDLYRPVALCEMQKALDALLRRRVGMTNPTPQPPTAS
jgi:hypothetical protein